MKKEVPGGAAIDINGPFEVLDCRLCGGNHDWTDCDVVEDLKNKLKGKK